MKIEFDRQEIEYILDKVAGLLGPKTPKTAKSVNGDDVEEMLSVKEMAEYYGMPLKQVQVLVDSGAIPSKKVGRSVKVRRADVDAWLSRGGNESDGMGDENIE